MNTLPTLHFMQPHEKEEYRQLLFALESIQDTTAIKLIDNSTLNEAALSINQYKALDKRIEKVRKMIVDPINGLVKETNAHFSNLRIQSPIPTELDRLSKEVLNFNAAEKKKADDLRKAEQARLEEEALNNAIQSGKDEPAIIVETVMPSYKVADNTAYITTAKIKKWRVTDITLVPRTLFNLDEVAINAVRRASKAEDISSIPGIEFYTEDSLRTK